MSVRWNSSLIMIRRLVEQKNAINKVAFDKMDMKLTLTKGEWILLQPLIDLLTPVEEASLLFSKSTISVQFPYAKTLVHDLSKLDLRVPRNIEDEDANNDQIIIELEQVRKRLIEGIKERFFELENKK
jgi:hypothetical protein